MFKQELEAQADQPSALQHVAHFWEILPVRDLSNPDASFAEGLAFSI